MKHFILMTLMILAFSTAQAQTPENLDMQCQILGSSTEIYRLASTDNEDDQLQVERVIENLGYFKATYDFNDPDFFTVEMNLVSQPRVQRTIPRRPILGAEEEVYWGQFITKIGAPDISDYVVSCIVFPKTEEYNNN
jgi:hypothetical protein